MACVTTILSWFKTYKEKVEFLLLIQQWCFTLLMMLTLLYMYCIVEIDFSFVPKMTYYVSGGTLDGTQSVTLCH